MTKWEIKALIAAALTTAPFLAYAVWIALSAERADSNLDIAIIVVAVAAGPVVWIGSWRGIMQLMGERP